MMQTLGHLIYYLPVGYIVLVNLIAFVAMWWDKWKASRNDWRIAEMTLHIIGLLGGAIGIFIGMFLFYHKTNKKSFQAVAAIGLITSLVIYWLVFISYI